MLGGQTLCFALRYKEPLHRRDVDPGGRDGVGESPGGGLSLAEVLLEVGHLGEESWQIAGGVL